MTLKYELTEREAELAFAQVQAHCKALKNWIAGAVEDGKLVYARELVTQLREHERLFAKLNVEADRFIEANRPKPPHA